MFLLQGGKISTQELMENLLNGKNIDEIEFQPNSTPVKNNDEFHFGPNSVTLTPGKILDQSEALSTKAVFGDDSNASYLDDKNLTQPSETSVIVQNVQEFQPIKDQDPMSASFYQEKENDTNPFDLNKVQILPDNLDEFLNKSPDVVDDSFTFNDTISDLPQHSPLAGMEVQKDELVDAEVVSNQTQVTDLDKPSDDLEPRQTLEIVKEDKLADFLSVEAAPKSPKPDSESSFEHIASPVQNIEESKSPVQFEEFSDQKSPAPELLNLGNSETVSPVPQSSFPELGDTLAKEIDNDVCQIPQFQEPEVISPEPTQENLCQLQSPNVISPEPQSPVVATPEVSDYLCQSPEIKSPVPAEQTICDLDEVPKDESSCSLPQVSSPEFDTENLHLLVDSSRSYERIEVGSPVRDEIELPKESSELQQSNIVEHTEPSEPTLESNSLNFAQELSNAIQETIPAEVESNQQKMQPPEAEMIMSTPKSTMSDLVEIESVATTDVNSFLDRSDVPEVESPLNVTEEVAIPSESLLIPEVALPVAAAAAAAAVAVGAAAAADKKPAKSEAKPKSGIAAKKSLPSKAAPKPAAKAPATTKPPPITRPAPGKPAALKPAAAKPLAAAPRTSVEKAAPKPRTSLTKAPVAEKKPLVNGDAKTASSARTNLTARKSLEAKTTPKSSPFLNKTAPRLSGENKTTSRPATAPAAKPAAPRSTAPVSKPRPGVALSARSTMSSTAKAAPSTTAKVHLLRDVQMGFFFCGFLLIAPGYN